MGCCESKKRNDPTWDLERVEVHGPNVSHSSHQRPTEFHDAIEVRNSYTIHKIDEHQFFQIFFSRLDHLPGHQGILRRWEREAQRAECDDGGRYDMRKVWTDGIGYVKTLERVKGLVGNKNFRWSDRNKLADRAAKVVKRRSAEYNNAKTQGKADFNHKRVLDEWRRVKETLQLFEL